MRKFIMAGLASAAIIGFTGTQAQALVVTSHFTDQIPHVISGGVFAEISENVRPLGAGMYLADVSISAGGLSATYQGKITVGIGGTSISVSPFGPIASSRFTGVPFFAHEVVDLEITHAAIMVLEGMNVGGPLPVFPSLDACFFNPVGLCNPGIGDIPGGLGSIGVLAEDVTPNTPSDYVENRGHNILSIRGGSFNVVPIPAALPLLASGLGLLGFFGWRRRNS